MNGVVYKSLRLTQAEAQDLSREGEWLAKPGYGDALLDGALWPRKPLLVSRWEADHLGRADEWTSAQAPEEKLLSSLVDTPGRSVEDTPLGRTILFDADAFSAWCKRKSENPFALREVQEAVGDYATRYVESLRAVLDEIDELVDPNVTTPRSDEKPEINLDLVLPPITIESGQSLTLDLHVELTANSDGTLDIDIDLEMVVE